MKLPDAIDGAGTLFRRQVVHIEAVDAAAGVMEGRAVPYDQRIELLPGVFERFESGAFAAQVGAKDQHARVKLLYSHDTSIVPLGRASVLSESAGGLDIRFQWNMRLVEEPGSQARQAFISVAEGDLEDLSIGFTAKSTRVERDGDSMTLVRRRAHLAEVSLVPYGAYGKAAQLTSLRNEDTWREGWLEKIAALGSS